MKKENTIVEYKDNHSSEYIVTVRHHTPIGKKIIERARRHAKAKGFYDGKKYRIVLAGRMGEDNPNAHKYSVKTPKAQRNAWCGGHSHQNIKLKDAAYADVYIYERY